MSLEHQAWEWNAAEGYPAEGYPAEGCPEFAADTKLRPMTRWGNKKACDLPPLTLWQVSVTVDGVRYELPLPPELLRDLDDSGFGTWANKPNTLGIFSRKDGFTHELEEAGLGICCMSSWGFEKISRYESGYRRSQKAICGRKYVSKLRERCRVQECDLESINLKPNCKCFGLLATSL